MAPGNNNKLYWIKFLSPIPDKVSSKKWQQLSNDHIPIQIHLETGYTGITKTPKMATE